MNCIRKIVPKEIGLALLLGGASIVIALAKGGTAKMEDEYKNIGAVFET